jgi:SAM-dependent methyltransferase
MQVWSEDTANHWRNHYDESAVHWGKWADQIAEQQVKVNQGLLMAAGVKPGAKLLDLASGAGEPAITAAAMVGPEGQVTATDISAPMVAAMNARFTRHGLVNIVCQQADMEALPFADGSFDAVTCRYGLMYARDPARAVAEAARVVRPGGRVAFMVWGPEENNNLLFHGLRAANEFLGKPIAEEDFHVPTRYAAPGFLAGLLSTAGLHEAREQEIVVEPKIKTGVPFWAPLLEMNAAHIWSGLTPEEQKKVHQAVAKAYEPFRDGEHYLLKTHIRLISGLRPARSA